MEIQENSWKEQLRLAYSKLSFFDSGTQVAPAKPGDKWQIPDSLKKNKAKWARVLTQMYKHPMSFPGSVSPHTGELLRALIVNIAPRNVLEIGSFIGISSIWIASAMAEYERRQILYCIDLFPPHTNNPWCPGVVLQDPLKYMLSNLKKCGFDHFVKIFQGDSKKMIPELSSRSEFAVDFAVIDGDHSIKGCLADFELIGPLVSPGGYILLHDMFPEYCGVDGPAYTLLNKILPYNKKFEVCQIYTNPLNFGYALVRKTGN